VSKDFGYLLGRFVEHCRYTWPDDAIEVIVVMAPSSPETKIRVRLGGWLSPDFDEAALEDSFAMIQTLKAGMGPPPSLLRGESSFHPKGI
jgi:hypothetical protein